MDVQPNGPTQRSRIDPVGWSRILDQFNSGSPGWPGIPDIHNFLPSRFLTSGIFNQFFHINFQVDAEQRAM